MIRLAHLADLHLGSRQFSRSTPAGINQREADVALAFRQAVDQIITAQPQLVCVAGDVFHAIRPSNLVMAEAVRQFRRLADGVRAPVILAAGNHDSPRSSEVGYPLTVLKEALPQLWIATQDVQSWMFGDAHVVVVPHAALVRGQTVPAPKPNAINLLVIHGATPGLRGPAETASAPFDAAQAGPWAYVALGDYHCARQVAPHAWYSGSLEYVSSNPWAELQEEAGRGKAWLLVTLERGQAPNISVQSVPTRRHVDLPPIDGTEQTVSALVAAIIEHAGAVEPWEGIIARQLVTGLRRRERRELLSAPPIKALALKALHFRLDARLAPRREQQPIDAPLILEPREPWEEEQDREAKYWDGCEPCETGLLPTLQDFESTADPYNLDARSAA